MSDVPQNPDYTLDETFPIETDAQRKAIAEPTRRQILDLVMQRAASVTELAGALDRPKSSVAYHVDLLESLGLLKVVRTRKVRAMEERFYGRTGRTLMHGGSRDDGVADRGDWLLEARNEMRSDPVDVMSLMRHVRIPPEQAEEFFGRVQELVVELTHTEPSGDTVFGFVAAIYATDLPILPEPE